MSTIVVKSEKWLKMIKFSTTQKSNEIRTGNFASKMA